MIESLILNNGNRYTWLCRLDPHMSDEALSYVFDLSPRSWGGENTNEDIRWLNINVHHWLNDQNVPEVSECLTKPQPTVNPGVEPMTDVKNPIAKSEAYIARHDLRSKMTLAENGTISASDDMFEATALLDAGLTLDQIKKYDKAVGELLPASLIVGGELASEAFKRDPNLTETGFSMKMGNHQKYSVLYHRDDKAHTTAVVETTHRSAEYSRAMAHVNSLFDDINN